MEQYGNTTTYNIESVLHKNIKDGEYFNKTCVKLTTCEELIDEVRFTLSGRPTSSAVASHDSPTAARRSRYAARARR